MNLSHPKHVFPYHTPWPCHVFPASKMEWQDGIAVLSKMSSPAAPHPHCQTGGLPHPPAPTAKALVGQQAAGLLFFSAHLMMKSNSEPASMRTPRRVETAPSITGAKVCSSAAAERTFLLPAAVRKP